uniref:Putative ovule protein n=1 Tax=Solanum chacoense TaxID=4108 RepID=A0A0V0HXG7_SOLCH
MCSVSTKPYLVLLYQLFAIGRPNCGSPLVHSGISHIIFCGSLSFWLLLVTFCVGIKPCASRLDATNLIPVITSHPTGYRKKKKLKSFK